MSEIFKLFLSSKTGITTAGPIPIMSGGHPATW